MAKSVVRSMTDSCVTDIRARHKRNIRLTWILLILGLVVACSVAWTLRGVGITMANETVCGMEEHQHSAACYADIADGGQLICTLPEHIHTVACTGIDTANNGPPVVEITTPTEDPTEPATEPERETVQLPNYLADASASYEKNVIYVKTALGERSKDAVHEYLDILGSLEDSDGKYVPNSEKNPYILQVGDTVELCYYTDDSKPSRWSESEPKGKVFSTPTETYTVLSDGTHKFERTYQASGAGKGTIHLGDQNFYVSVPDPTQELKDFHYDHADIEITDGGYYEIKRTVTDPNGNQVTTRQIFDSYISGVNHCYIYKADGTRIRTYESTDYESHGNPGETQYELTSKFKCSRNEEKWVKCSEVDHAQFDVQLLLKPRKQIVTVTKDGKQISQTETDISDSSGESDVTILSAEFTMNHRSVVDANNKCPDHSGLDFNLMANVNHIITVEPASVEPAAHKQLTNGSIGTNQFRFELLDKDGKLIDRQYCDTNGQVTFESQYFLKPGTYTYTIRESIPSEAVQIDGKPYSGGIFYDSHTETVTVTVTADAQGNLSASMAYAGGSAPVFHNTAVTERYMPISVQKVWSDSSTVNHKADAIGFRIWRTESGQPDALVSIDGKSKFYLNDASGWKWSYTKLPVQYAGRTYSYRVEEVDFPDGYIAGYTSGQNGGTLEYTITNTPKDAITLSIQKQWLAPDGTPMQGTPTAQSVSALLQRQCKEVEIPVTIQVVSPAGALLEQYKQHAYVGSSFTFTLGVTEGTAENVSVLSADQCSAAYANGVFTVQDIQVGARVRVQCDNVMDSTKLLLHHTFEDTQEGWTCAGSKPGGAYATYYANTGSGYHALKIYNRTKAWMGASFTLDSSVIKPGQTYSFSAYLNRAAVFTEYTESGENPTHDLGADHTAPLNLTLYYKDSAGDPHYQGIAAVAAASSGTWIHLRNTGFTIPADCTVMQLQVDTGGEEDTDNKFSDLYLDEVIIAPAGMDISVEQNTGRVLLNNPEFSFTVTGNTIPADVQQKADNWNVDAWNKRIEITAAEDWIKTLSGAELEQVSNRIYQYFVQENPMTGFTPSYSDMYVSSNTAQTPMIIKNQSIAYTLPATGGVGLVPFLGGGSLLILASGLYSYKLIRRKRRSSA